MHRYTYYTIRHWILLLLIQSCCCFQLRAQGITTLHSLFEQTYPTADSAAIINLIGDSPKFLYHDFPKSIRLVDSAMRLSQRSRFVYGIGNAYIAYANYALISGNYLASDSFLQLARPYCYQASQQSGSNNLLVLWLQNKNNLAVYTGDYDKALTFSLHALHLLEEKEVDSGFVSLKIGLYNDIGSVLQYLQQPDKALYYLRTGEALAKARRQPQKLASLYVNFGNAYRQKEAWQKSRDYLIKAVSLAKQHQDEFVLQVAYLSLANGYLFENEPDSAIIWLDKTASISKNINPYMRTVFPDITLGNIYLGKSDYKQAIRYGTKALKMGQEIHAPQTVCLAHKLLFKSYRAMGQWTKAFSHLEAYTTLNDSLSDAKKIVDINRLEVQYRVAKKDKQLVEQAFALSRQKNALREKNFWIAGVGFAGSSLLILLLLVRKNQIHRQKHLTGEIELARMKAILEGEEQERIRIARALHDGIVSQLLAVKLNLSTSIRNADKQPLKIEELQQGIDMLTEAMRDLRDTSHNLTNETFLRMGFQEAVAAFCDKINSSGVLKVVFQSYGIPPDFDKTILLSVFRIIQELVQNVLKHAQARTLLIQLSFQTDLMSITVQDDGKGLGQNKDAHLIGSGLSNLQERIESLKGICEISSDDTGTSVYLEFPKVCKPV